MDSSGLRPGVTTLRDSSLPVLSLQSVVYCHGGRVGFFQGDIRLLSDDMKALCPTIFPVVPRLLNRMYDKVSPKRSLWLAAGLDFCLYGRGLEPQADFPQALEVTSSLVFPDSHLSFSCFLPVVQNSHSGDFFQELLFPQHVQISVVLTFSWMSHIH